MSTEHPTADQLVEVKAFLKGGDLIALPVGNMAALFRVVHDECECSCHNDDWDLGEEDFL